jgi:hypothetical protein
MDNKKSRRSYFLELMLLGLAAFWLTGIPGTVQGAMDYLSTGIGVESREPHPEYSLKLEFSLQAGNYVAEVDVDIYQGGKKIKSIHSPEPWLYVNLPPGDYSVVATLKDGRSQGTHFTISKGIQKRVILSWPGM